MTTKPVIDGTDGSKQVFDPGSADLGQAGLQSMTVTGTADDADFDDLLTHLRTDDYDHTWKSIALDQSQPQLAQLIRLEQLRRPTHFFFYHGLRHDGTERLVAVGTVAERIRNDFPFDGYPVIARAFIHPEFRKCRVYPAILMHRVRVCQALFADRLKLIHLGTANERIFKTIRYNIMGLPFIYIGNENFEGRSIVRDFVCPTERFKSDMEHQLIEYSAGCPKSGRIAYAGMVNLIFRMLVNQFDDTGYHQLKKFYSRLDEDSIPPLLKELFVLLKSIPLIDTDSRVDKIFDDPELPKIRKETA